jgi:CRISPR-associated protein Cas2
MRKIYQPLSPYQAMWIIVMFDLPTQTKKQRKDYTEFRNYLLDTGFMQSQYSVYLKNAPSRELMNSYMDKLKQNLPPAGYVNAIPITDKQYKDIYSFRGQKQEKMSEKDQLSLF